VVEFSASFPVRSISTYNAWFGKINLPSAEIRSMQPLETLSIVRGQLTFAREYTQSLLADIADDQWFTMPTGLTTHIAWQVGHLAMAQYGLCLFRVRGRRPEDLELMPSKVRKLYSKGSLPDPLAENQPTPSELRALLSKIHEQVLLEMNEFTAEQLTEPTDMPYSVFPTKLGALLFCPQHEMLHAGQIGLIRRALGKNPVR
jgi:hypothetical protein